MDYTLKPEIEPETSLSDKKQIYLTFDDGPSIITNTVLDILKNNDVKATFFVIGNQIDGYEDVIRRIQEEGHSMGLHSYTHNFRKIYRNHEAFLKEMYQCRDKIYETTGLSPNIIRFPGGSRNILTESYLDELHKLNFKVYDWNAETEDGLNPKVSPYRLYKEAIKGSNSLPYVMLLLHCDYMHKNTCKALPDIIKYYKNAGFEFEIITEDTPELIYPITKKKISGFIPETSY